MTGLASTYGATAADRHIAPDVDTRHAPRPVFSLVLATYGKGREITRFLDSLLLQTVSLEVVVVDQNEDDAVKELILQYSDRIPVVYLRSSLGLSLARNVGVESASGQVIAFPDDDCWYPKGLLKRIARRLSSLDIAGLTCRCTDENGRASAGRDDRRRGDVTFGNAWNRGVSTTLFLKRFAVRKIGIFDEDLGMGSPGAFQSGEETDYILRGLARKLRIIYDPDLQVHHPRAPGPDTPGATVKAWGHGLGMGRVLRKHRYARATILYHVLMPMVGAGAALCGVNLRLARLRLARALARWRGWRFSTRGDAAPFKMPKFLEEG